MGKRRMINAPSDKAIRELLSAAGLGHEYSLQPLIGGANNRVYSIQMPKRRLVLKAYFYDPEGGRDRLESEFSFLQYLWKRGIRSVPEPLSSLPALQFALYEFVQGRKLLPHEVTGERVSEALEFILSANHGLEPPDYTGLPLAYGACFTAATHIEQIESRVTRLLTSITGSDRESIQAKRFVESTLLPAYDRFRRALLDELGSNADNISSGCLSPSDFGFHNALVGDEDKLLFIDFEDAGYDDPAKLVCDFFCRPALPAGEEHLRYFVDSICRAFPEDKLLAKRISLLLPLYRIKWCCVLLNEFLPSEGKRSLFSRGDGADLVPRRKRGLDKAERMLERLLI